MMDFDDMNRFMGAASYGFGWLFTLLWLILIVLAVVALVYWLMRQNRSSFQNTNAVNKTPLDILKERYSKGEITKDQFDQMKIDLG